MDLTKVKYLYEKSLEDKDKIKPIYNEVLELTDPFQVIKDEGKIELGTQRDVDSDVLSSIDTLSSYIMSSVLTKSAQWADLEVDELKMKEMFGDNAQRSIDEIKGVLQEDIDRVFKYIQNSNYYEEVSKSVKDFIRVGTGCFSIRETGVPSSPFIFEYVGLDNLFIANDNFSRPSIVFKKHPEVNGEYLRDVFGRDIQLESGISDDEYDKTINVFECVVPSYDENSAITTYTYMICDESFSKVYMEKELPYNPFVVFHWDTVPGTAWGISVVLNQKNLLKELNEYKTIFKTQAKTIANPPKGFIGNIELFESLSLEEGMLNYFGDYSQGTSSPSIQNIGGNGNLMPLDTVINNLLRQFKESVMVSHLSMNTQDTKYNTAYAIQVMHEMFRKRFANTYELINSELIQPTFLTPFIIMLRIGALNLTEDVLPFVAVRYISELTKSDNMAKVNKLMMYMQTANQLEQYNKMGVLIDLPKALATIQDLMEIPHNLVPDESTIREYQEYQRQMALQQQQVMAQQEMVENEQI